MASVDPTSLASLIMGKFSIDYSKKSFYTMSADEAGNMLEKLALVMAGKITAPKPAKAGAGRNIFYYKNIEGSLKSFQKNFGLKADGKLNVQTAKKLKEIYQQNVAVRNEGPAKPEQKPEAEKDTDAEPDSPPPPSPKTPTSYVNKEEIPEKDYEVIPVGEEIVVDGYGNVKKRTIVAVIPKRKSSEPPPERTPERTKQFTDDEVALNQNTSMGSNGIISSDEYYSNPENYHRVVQGVLNLPEKDQREYLKSMSIEQMESGTLGYTKMGEDAIHVSQDGLKEKGYGIFGRLNPEMLDNDPKRVIYPPQYTIAHEFAHLLTFNKWLGEKKSQYMPVMQQLWTVYMNGFNKAYREIKSAVANKSIQNIQQAMEIARKYLPSDYVSTFAVRALQAQSSQELRQTLLTGYLEFIAEMYSPALLYDTKFKADAEGKTYAQAIPLIEQLINDGGNPVWTPESDRIHRQYKTASTQTAQSAS